VDCTVQSTVKHWFLLTIVIIFVHPTSQIKHLLCKEGAPPHSSSPRTGLTWCHAQHHSTLVLQLLQPSATPFSKTIVIGWLHNPSIYTFRLKVSLTFVIRRSFLCSSFMNSSSNCTCRVRCTLNMPASCLVSPFSCALV